MAETEGACQVRGASKRTASASLSDRASNSPYVIAWSLGCAGDMNSAFSFGCSDAASTDAGGLWHAPAAGPRPTPARLSQSYSQPASAHSGSLLAVEEERLQARGAVSGRLERLDAAGRWRACDCELSKGTLACRAPGGRATPEPGDGQFDAWEAVRRFHFLGGRGWGDGEASRIG